MIRVSTYAERLNKAELKRDRQTERLCEAIDAQRKRLKKKEEATIMKLIDEAIELQYDGLRVYRREDNVSC